MLNFIKKYELLIIALLVIMSGVAIIALGISNSQIPLVFFGVVNISLGVSAIFLKILF